MHRSAGGRACVEGRAAAAVLAGAALLACTEPNPSFRPSDLAGDSGPVGPHPDAARGGQSGTGGESGQGGQSGTGGALAVDAPEETAPPATEAGGSEPPLQPAADATGTGTDVRAADAPAVDAPASPCGGVAPTGWACIPAGTFTMGSPSGETGRDSDETAHKVTLTRSFWMQTTEVTQAAWQAAMGSNPSKDQSCGATCPVEQVSWFQTVVFANLTSIRDGYPPCYDRSNGAAYDAAAAARFETPRWSGLGCRGYRLATEAEWEYAARAGTTTAFWNGPLVDDVCSPVDASLASVSWYCGNANSAIRPVAMKRPNPWGLYDVYGNVWEWLWDVGTADKDYPSGAAIDPLGDTSGSFRRDRGGAHHNEPGRCRSANRDAVTPEDTLDDMGVRLVRTAL
jgi:formylglycine-generating enzyme required for sulfatase activity